MKKVLLSLLVFTSLTANKIDVYVDDNLMCLNKHLYYVLRGSTSDNAVPILNNYNNIIRCEILIKKECEKRLIGKPECYINKSILIKE